MLMSLNRIVLIFVLIVRIESRRNLRDYIVSHNYSSGLTREEFAVYDPVENNVICRLQSLGNVFNRLTNLVSYPSRQRIASIRNVWSPFFYQGYFNVFDDQLNEWMIGRISQRSHPQGLTFTIEYEGRVYTMINRIGSSITDIRDSRRSNLILTRFSQTYLDPIFGSSKYNIQIYTDDLPDPIYILALYALDSIKPKRRIQFIP